jgi:AhpD family alkylhydroperoxidase
MSLRLPYQNLLPAGYKALIALTGAVKSTTLETPLVDLVFQRVSQINGCAYCVDLHWRDLIAAGETPQRVNSLLTWREVDFFSERERAALHWAERVTSLGNGHPTDADYAPVREHFSDEEIAALTMAIATMNAWNRLAISMRMPVAQIK